MNRLLCCVMLLAAISTPATAHEKYRIVGTVVTVQATQLDVKAVDGATYEIDMDDTTQVVREFKKVPRSELRPGQRVVVDALGHDMFDLEAVLVTVQN